MVLSFSDSESPTFIGTKMRIPCFFWLFCKPHPSVFFKKKHPRKYRCKDGILAVRVPDSEALKMILSCLGIQVNRALWHYWGTMVGQYWVWQRVGQMVCQRFGQYWEFRFAWHSSSSTPIAPSEGCMIDIFPTSKGSNTALPFKSYLRQPKTDRSKQRRLYYMRLKPANCFSFRRERKIPRLSFREIIDA